MHIFPTHKQRKSFSTYPHETIGGALVALKKRKEKKRKARAKHNLMWICKIQQEACFFLRCT
jgi:hypothetical protein